METKGKSGGGRDELMRTANLAAVLRIERCAGRPARIGQTLGALIALRPAEGGGPWWMSA